GLCRRFDDSRCAKRHTPPWHDAALAFCAALRTARVYVLRTLTRPSYRVPPRVSSFSLGAIVGKPSAVIPICLLTRWASGDHRVVSSSSRLRSGTPPTSVAIANQERRRPPPLESRPQFDEDA